ncbi:hypothetical protein QTP88_011014 [Uroleucon formosanum]
MLCLVCNDEIYDGDEIKCKNCKDYLHFSCASFRETAFRKLTHEAKLKFSCAKCKVNMGLNSNTKSKNEDVFVGSNETLSDLTNSVEFMSAKFDDFNLKNENCEKVVENIVALMGQPVTVIKAYSIRSKIPNKPMKIIAELSSTHQKKTLMESAKKKKVKACSINESWGNGDKINTFVKMSTTKKVFNSKNNKIREWMTAGLLCSVHFKRKLSLKVRKYPNNVRLAIPKLTWKVINEILDKNNNKNDDVKVIKIDNYTLDVKNEPLNIANIFNNFFINIGNSLACNIEDSTFKFEENITPISFNSTFNENIKESDVRVMINKLKDDTAVGFDVTYADDTCLLYCGDSWSDVSTKATRESKIVVEFLKLRNLSINFKKTMFVNFSINDVKDNFNELTLHFCENGTLCNGTVCQKLFRVSNTRYLGLTFDNHLRWNLHVNNIVMRLRSLNYSFYKLRKILSVHVMRTVYLALYQAIFQYGLLIWGGLSYNALKPLLLHQRQIVRVCLQKTNYVGSTGLNFKEFNVLPVDLVFKKMAIMWVIKHLDKWVEKNEISNKRAFRSFDAKTSFCKKSVGQKFVDYLGPIYYNSMPFSIKKNVNINYRYHNAKKLINDWLHASLNET